MSGQKRTCSNVKSIAQTPYDKFTAWGTFDFRVFERSKSFVVRSDIMMPSWISCLRKSGDELYIKVLDAKQLLSFVISMLENSGDDDEKADGNGGGDDGHGGGASGIDDGVQTFHIRGLRKTSVKVRGDSAQSQNKRAFLSFFI